MKISELVVKLLEIHTKLGDVDVYIGSHYQDLPIQGVELEDSYPVAYPLIFNDDLH